MSGAYKIAIEHVLSIGTVKLPGTLKDVMDNHRWRTDFSVQLQWDGTPADVKDALLNSPCAYIGERGLVRMSGHRSESHDGVNELQGLY